jgi:hypothetical protein
MTFLEWPLVSHSVAAWKWGEAIIKRGAKLTVKVATLEARVTALEEALGKQPADACPYCGERAMRMTRSLGAIIDSGATTQWKKEWWTCAKCGQEDERVRKF